MSKSIALIDYGIGNLRSVQKALETVGAPAGVKVILTDNPDQILQANKVVLPGVGAFGDGMRGLEERRLIGALRTLYMQGTPLLGICLGMQLFFQESEEAENPGLAFLPGLVRRFPDNSLKVPQTGWNQIHTLRHTSLLDGLKPGSYAYFNHSYYCDPMQESDRLASSSYGLDYASVAGRGRLYGVQFHPEKSQAVGLQILRNFVEHC
ncbi:imidazole glycerol phosphate synthase subunit HisH [Chloroflexota bacterium]